MRSSDRQSAPSPRAPARSHASGTRRPRDYSRWRAATLIGVHVLIAAHIAHWRLAGRTLAPLELNEVMYTLELGIVTAGFIFMALAGLSTLVFGRFFCSWGCHILALQDLSAWLLGKLRIRPRPVRSRVLRWAPIGAMLYMFAWPQVSRVLAGRPLPRVHVLSDAQGWASFLTSNFWRNLPGPGIALLTFAVCGFVIVYVLGSRAFCTYACPYGAVFGLADRIAPGRIIARGDCSNCGKCTAVCQSHVRVHEELSAFGRVINPACLKDLDCISACPDGKVAYGWTRPSLFSLRRGGVGRLPYDFSRGEDVLMAAVFVAVLLIFRGLYDAVPFLLTLALGGILAHGAVVALRLRTRPHVRLNNWQLRIGGRSTTAGRAFLGFSFALLLGVAHCALIRYHEVVGQRRLRLIASTPAPQLSDILVAIRHAEFRRRWGLVQPASLWHDLASLHQAGAAALRRDGRVREALDAYARAAAFQCDPQRRGLLHAEIGTLLLDAGQPGPALARFRQAAADVPNDARVRYNLALTLSALGRDAEALAAYQASLALDPADPETHNNVGFLLADRGDLDRAAAHFERAIRLKPDYAHPYFNLARVRLQQNDQRAAARLFETAARLDATFAEILRADPARGGGG